MNILFFGILAEKTGTTSLSLDNIVDTNSLKSTLAQRFPELQELNFIISVNRKIVHGNTTLDPHAEVAMLHPFSGG